MTARVSLADLSPDAQRQAARQILPPAKRPNKYRNVPTEGDGIRFASRKEQQRYFQLKTLERAGEIAGLRVQPRFSLDVNGICIATYVADFEYVENGRRVVEDVKGIRTREFILKSRLMRALHGIDVAEVR